MLYLACPYSHPNPSLREERFRIGNVPLHRNSSDCSAM
jgi:hypothetical protein